MIQRPAVAAGPQSTGVSPEHLVNLEEWLHFHFRRGLELEREVDLITFWRRISVKLQGLGLSTCDLHLILVFLS